MSDRVPHELIPPGVNDSRSRAFASALERLLSEFSTSALLVQDPMKIDSRLLPAMVVQLAMTDFVPLGLKEAPLRRLLAAAPEIHRKTGTVQGARLALQALGVKVVWKQWFQLQPKGLHDTHIVTAYVNQQFLDDEPNLLSARTQAAVRKALDATQRWSQDIAFQLGVAFDSNLGIATAGRAASVARPAMRASANHHPAGAMGVAAAGSAALLTVNPMSASAGHRPGGELGCIAAGRAIMVINARMEASP